MKKTSVIALNFRFMRLPLILCIFTSLVASIVILSLNAPPLSLGKGLSDFFISSGGAVKTASLNIGFLSLEKNMSGKEKSGPAVNVNPPPAEKVQIVSKSPVAPVSPENVSVSNSTDYSLDIKNYLSGTPSFLKDNFSVLIVHTHTTESYTPSEKYNYTPSDTDRTLDKNYNMVKVGSEIAKVLEKEGIKVYHDSTINDYPSYNGSYNRSAANVTNAIKNDSSIKIVLDVHRDAIEGANGEKTKYTCTIDGKTAASVMLVSGSNLSGLSHDNWEKNLNFAATLQAHIQSLYPGLMRPINFRSQRFNQQLAPGAIIVEVGTNGNTLDEALLGAKYFAEGLASYIGKGC